MFILLDVYKDCMASLICWLKLIGIFGGFGAIVHIITRIVYSKLMSNQEKWMKLAREKRLAKRQREKKRRLAKRQKTSGKVII